MPILAGIRTKEDQLAVLDFSCSLGQQQHARGPGCARTGRQPASSRGPPPHRSMGMRYSLDAVKHHCRQRFEAIGLLHIIYLSLGDFRMLQRPGPLRGHTDERAWGLVHPSIRFDWRNGALMQCMSKPDPIMPERS